MNHSEAGRLGAAKTHKIFIERYASHPKKCFNCDTELKYEQRKNKFCSHTCSAIYTNQGRNRRESWIKKYEKSPRRCMCCNVELPFELRRSAICVNCASNEHQKQINQNELYNKLRTGICLNCGSICYRKFCNAKCRGDYFWRNKKIEIEKNGLPPDPRIAKRYLLEQSDRCRICGINEWCGKPIMLILDHVDGNSENWELSNLRLICSNCDSLLPTYKSKNKGNGRYKRRLRYKEGKSY